MIQALRVVLLGEGGGLDVTAAETTEAVVQALDICTQVERAYVLGTSPGSPGGAAMESIVFLRDRAARPFCRIRRLAWLAARSEKIHLVICEHQNLLLAAWLIARLRGARLAAILTDGGDWQAPGSWFAPFLAKGIDSFATFDVAAARQFSLWSGIPRDRGVLLQRPRRPQASDAGEPVRPPRAPNAFAADVADWLWGV